MKNITLKSTMIAVLISGAIMAPVAYADHYNKTGNGSGNHRGYMHQMFRGLDLTDQQRGDIREVMKKYKAQMKQNNFSAQDRKDHKAQMLAVITANSFDETAAKKVIADGQTRRQQTMLLKLKMQQEVYQLLTPEQQQEFKGKFTKKHGKNKRKR